MEKIRTFLKYLPAQIKYRFWFAIEWIRENKKTFFKRSAIVFVIIWAIFWIFFRTCHDYDVIQEVQRKGDTSVNYHFGEEGILCYSKDGVSFTNNDGEVLWNQVFGMEAPKMDDCGDNIAIGDIGANNLYILDQSGLKGKLVLEKPIQDLCISKQGIVAVILEDGAANQINMYSKEGQMLVSIKVSIGNGGYPLTMALSEDGTRLAVSYIMFNGGKVSSRLVFYDFSNKETSSEPSGAFEFDELIPRVEFVEKNTVLASGESGFYLYQCGKTVMQKHAQTFSGEAKSIFVTEDSIGIITKNPEIAKAGKTVDKYKVQIYRFSGTRAGGFTFDFDYKEVSASGKDIIFYNDQECEIYSYRGRKKFQHVFDRNIESVLPGNESGEYILLDQQKVQTITLK